MLDTKITRILMNMATCEEGIAKSHTAKAKLLRELAAEIEFPDQPIRTENPKPNPKSPFHVEIVPLNDKSEEDAEEIGKAVVEWLKKLQGITAHPTSWPF